MDGLSLQVGKYDIQEMLGKGATGTVYLAKDTFSGREVALKTIEPEVFRDPEFGTVHRSAFLNEASLAGKIRHPHIVAILDAVVEENSGHIAMEVVRGGDLAQFATPDKLLPVADALQIVFKCCGALDYAFREGIVHRDIKPANIMVARGTEPKISDFGAAFLKRGEAAQTAAMGSPYYMSPEQIEGRELTFHSDMFSLGVVLYELLTGQRPFTGATLEELVQKILQQDPAPPSTLRAGVPKHVDALVLTALMKKPAYRHASWAEFAEAISAAVGMVIEPGVIADTEKFTALKKVEKLAALPDAELWEIVNAGAWMRVPAGTLLIQEGEAGDSVFFLAKGQAKVTLGGKLINLVNETEFVGDMAWILGTGAARSASVDAMTDLLVAEYAPQAVSEITLGAQLHLTRAVARNLVDRLAMANLRLAR